VIQAAPLLNNNNGKVSNPHVFLTG
jgi:hypothetical protein